MNKEERIISLFSHRLNGDDGAILGDLCLSKDLFIEDVHFKRGWLSSYEIGTKAALVNLSDAFAMNATPRYALLGLALPKTMKDDEIKVLCAGIKDTCEAYDVKIIGGDTTSSDKIVISLSIIAKNRDKILYRKRAKLGDFVAFSGDLGRSLKGLKTLQNGGFVAKNSRFKAPLLRRDFIYKSARYLSSCMDISDGLLNDLPKLLKKHQRVRLNRPLSKAELISGEEYELLFTFSPKNAAAVQNRAKKCRVKLNIIGKITNAKSNLPRFNGFKHF